ncbi:OmpA family protein, partial [Winogradskyella vincentii]
VNVENVPFNSENSDFGSFIYNDKLYFASARDNENEIYSWNKEPFLDLYQLTVSDTSNVTTYGSVSKISSNDINTDFHEASIAITNDGKTIYFTRDNVTKRNKLAYDKKGTAHLKIYKATLVDDQWTNSIELPFNDKIYSTGHPALSPDNKTLYFVSDREGGIGQTDIYSVAINDDGTYGEPENLGETVNTEGREMFPFVSKDNTLYFSSDGYLNLGLLDIFKSNKLKGERDEPENLGAPYNSGYDDFAFFINTDTEQGYFSSNRPNGKGGDDIYSFNITECKQVITGTVIDSDTGTLLTGVNVRLIDETGKVIDELNTEDGSDFTFTVECDQSYTVVANKLDYKEDKQNIVVDNTNEKVNQADLKLVPLIIDNQIVINPIFFDFDKWNIRTDAQYELENIVDVLRKHPEMVIKIES